MPNPIEIDELVVSYPVHGGAVDVLKGISLTVEQGQIVGFLGPNGAGKTSTIHVLLGFIEATGGIARIFGENVSDSITRTRIGYLSENPQTYGFLTGRELLRMSGRIFNMHGSTLAERIGGLLKMVDLENAADRRIGTYSRGMLQRIGLAQALVNDPDLVILDEPTSGLDPLGRMKIRSIIADLRERGKTVFFSSHELSEVELVCDRIILLVDGKLAASGPVAELVQGGESLESYFLRMVREAGMGVES